MSLPKSLWLFALAAWIGLGIGTSFIGATTIFGRVPQGLITSDIAGTLAGDLFRTEHLIGLILLPILIVAGLRALVAEPRGRNAALALLAVALLLLAVDRFFLTPQIHALREEIGRQYGSMSQAPKASPERARFGMLHGASACRALVQMILEIAAFFLAAVRRPA